MKENRLKDQQHRQPKTYYGKLPPEAKRDFWINTVGAFVLLLIMPYLNEAGILVYRWQAYLYIFFLFLAVIIGFRNIEKKRKEAVERENFEMIAHAVSKQRNDIFYGDQCPYCGEALPDGASFCSHCGKRIGGRHVLH